MLNKSEEEMVRERMRATQYRIMEYEDKDPKLVARRHRILFNLIKITKLPDISVLEKEVIAENKKPTPKNIVDHVRHKRTNYDYVRIHYERKFTRQDLAQVLPAEINRRICTTLGIEYGSDDRWFSQEKKNSVNTR